MVKFITRNMSEILSEKLIAIYYIILFLEDILKFFINCE